MIKITISALSQSFDGFLFDAFGVLCDGTGLLPHAKECLQFLKDKGKGILIVSNGASMLPEQTTSKYQAMGLSVNEREVLTSLSLLKSFIAENKLMGAKVLVLGTRSSKEFVARCGVHVVENPKEDFSVVVVANQTDYPFLDSVNETISSAAKKILTGETVQFVLPNPDFLYPISFGQFGITAGAVAEVIERGVDLLCGPGRCKFVRLGKPFAPIFAAAKSHFAPNARLVMIGDQLETDIKGAQNAGIADALVGTGVASGWNIQQGSGVSGAVVPSFYLENLSPSGI